MHAQEQSAQQNNHTKHTSEHLSKSVKKNKSTLQSSAAQKSDDRHYIYPRTRAKNQARGAKVPDVSIKGNKLVPFAKADKVMQHNAIMHVYATTFHDKHGHVLQVMQAAGPSMQKEFKKFKKAVKNVCAYPEDWNLLQESMHWYDMIAISEVNAFSKEREAKSKLKVNKKLEVTLKKVAHSKPLLSYAAQSLNHSKLLLEEYAFNIRLIQHVESLQKAMENKKTKMKFNTPEMAQARNRMVALVVLLEGAAVHYGAIIEAYADEAQKQSVSVDNVIESLIREIKDTLRA